MINILFSTTRQWNPGDEFILRGIRNLFQEIGFSYNPVIYNRHPSITPRKNRLKGRLKKAETLPHYDNSFILDKSGVVDYVIFAGTPEWYGGKRMDDLHQYIVDEGLRCSFIGVGIPKTPVVSENLKKILTNQTDLFIARDPNCYDAFKWVNNSYYLPCPALFSSPFNRVHKTIDTLGIVVQDISTKNQKLPPELLQKLEKEYAVLEENFKVKYIAHYIDDLTYSKTKGNEEVLYSAFSEDYPNLFDQVDFVVAARVHGCGMASSLGIPNILIPHDGRYTTAIKFNSIIYNREKDSILDLVNQVDIEKKSQELIEHKEASKKIYLNLFKENLPF